MNRAAREELLRQLIVSLREDPASWKWTNRDKLHIGHTSGLTLWVSMGCHLYDPDIHFGWWGMLRLRRAFRYWRRVQGAAEWEVAMNRRVAAALLKLRPAPAESGLGEEAELGTTGWQPSQPREVRVYSTKGQLVFAYDFERDVQTYPVVPPRG